MLSKTARQYISNKYLRYARRLIPARCLCLSILLALAGAAAAQEGSGRNSPMDDLESFETYLDGVMAAQFRDWKLAGMTFALVRDGELALSKGYGVASIETGKPVDPAKTLFRPGSVSKLITWTAVMQLVEQGKIDLNAPISTYLDQFQLPDEFGTPLTMTHILTHTPGLEDGAAGFLFADEEEDLVPLADSLAAHQPNQLWKPGTYSAYSNWATAVAGLVVANVSGMGFEEYVANQIFAPLDMTQSTFEEPLPEALADMAQGYRAKHGGIEPMGFEFIKNFGPAGAMSASAEDMAKFIIAHVQDGVYGDSRILQPETTGLMHTRLFTHDPRVAGMAHGFYEMHRNGERFVGHGGDTIAFHSELVMQPETDFGFFISFNTPEGARARTAVVAAILDWFYPGNAALLPDYPSEPLAGSKDRLAKIAGAYRVNRRSFTQLEGVTALLSDVAITPVAQGEIALPGQTGGARFVEVEPWVFRQQLRQETLVFQTGDDGSVTRALVGSVPIMTLEKLAFWEAGSTHQLVIALALIAALFVLINAVRNRGKVSVSGGAKWGRRSLILAAVSFLAFALGLGAVISTIEMDRAIFDFPPPGTGLVLVLPLLGTLFTIACLGALVPVWRSNDCNVWQRIRYSYVTIAFALLVLVLAYWNLLGWNY